MDQITIQIKPMPYRRMNRFGKWAKANKKYHDYMQEIQYRVKEFGFQPTDRMKLVFYFAMPKSWSKKKKEEKRGTYHQQVPDLDNLVKGVLDALFYQQGGDSHVCEIQASKYWAGLGETTGIVFISNLEQGVLSELRSCN